MYENMLSSVMKPMGKQKSNSLIVWKIKVFYNVGHKWLFKNKDALPWKYLCTLAALHCSTYPKQQQCLPIMYFLCLGFHELQDHCLPVKNKNS